MTVLTKKELSRMEAYYYWGGMKQWIPFPEELKKALLEAYGEEPFPYAWSEQDIHVGTRRMIIEYFKE